MRLKINGNIVAAQTKKVAASPPLDISRYDKLARLLFFIFPILKSTTNVYISSSCPGHKWLKDKTRGKKLLTRDEQQKLLQI